ncbi:MAG: DUF5615 family PIN-like protein [Dermatophilaceae bacterium]
MRFLVDECLPLRTVDLLHNHGHDAIHVTMLGIAGSPDAAVLERAVAEDRVLLSADTDFGELLATSGARTPSVVLLRGLRGRPDARIRFVLANIGPVEEDLRAGALVVLTGQRIRVRSLPMTRQDTAGTDG